MTHFPLTFEEKAWQLFIINTDKKLFSVLEQRLLSEGSSGSLPGPNSVDPTWFFLFTTKVLARPAVTPQSYLLYLLGRIKQGLSPLRVGCSSLYPEPRCLDLLDAFIHQSRRKGLCCISHCLVTLLKSGSWGSNF